MLWDALSAWSMRGAATQAEMFNGGARTLPSLLLWTVVPSQICQDAHLYSRSFKTARISKDPGALAC